MKVRVLKNAEIYTGDASHPWAHVLALFGDRIVALDAEAERWSSAPGAIVSDMGGATIIPGLIDSHLHLMWYALARRELALRDLTREQLLRRVADQAAKVPPGTWIQGRNWDQNLWADSSFPTAAELDRVAPEHPVVLIAKSAHALVANSLAMRQAGISADTPSPVGGELGRGADGAPNGMFFEHAMRLILAAMPEPSLEEVAAALLAAQEQLLAVGLTGIHDVDGAPAFAAFQSLHRERALRVRVVKYLRQEALDGMLAAGLRSGFGDDWLCFGGVKLFADGALGARTAALLSPYEGEPENTGVLTLEREQLLSLARRAVLGGVSLAVHAIGDRTNRLVLDVLEQVRPLDHTLRHRIEHVQLIAPVDQPRLAELGVVAAMQPIHATHDQEMAERYWGQRSVDAYAWRSLRAQGTVLAFGSDAPIEVFDPWLGLYAAVTRRHEISGAPGAAGWYPAQRLALGAALRAYTWGGSYAAGMETRLGLLKPGFLADLVVLNHNIFNLPPEALLETQVTAVMVGGAWQFGEKSAR